ncbi:MAG TPA: tyrosine-protein phosphatase [Micromonosporaceae bacterium]
METFTGLLDWPDCRNVRDIGGMPAADGRRIRDRVLVRADSLEQLTDSGIAAARDYGVTTVLDMRSAHEIGGARHPFDVQVLPFVDAERDLERDAAAEKTTADLYRGSIDRNGRCVAALVSAIAGAPPGTIVVHCLFGGDRTGMLVALLLDLVGTPRSVIIEDYERTWAFRSDAAETGAIDQTMTHIDARWGGARGYLRQHGVTDAEISALRDRLLV